MSERIELPGGWYLEKDATEGWTLNTEAHRCMASGWSETDARAFAAAAIRPQVNVEAEEELCALIFNNVEANVGYVACGPIAILGDVTDAATAILNAGFRKHALRTRIEAEDRAKSGGEAK